MIGTSAIATSPLSVRGGGQLFVHTLPEGRTLYVPYESRTLTVPRAPEYTMTVPAVQRVVKIPPLRDTVTIGEAT